jgi:hypothetical protein
VGSEARNYCEAEKQSAGVVGDVDQCAWLDDHFSEAVTKLECVQEFCQEKFDSSGGWTVGEDPFGCMSYICDDDACGDSAGKQQCEQQFVTVHGDPALYMAPCEFNKCKKRLVDCLATTIQAGQWSHGDAIPTQCRGQQTLCELISRLVFELAVDLRPHIDPGPLQELVERPENPNPGKNLTRYIETFRGAVEAGAPEDTLNRLAVRLTSTPELIAALYHRSPDVFVGLYGRGLAEVLGPGVEQMPAREISRSELSPRGQDAFDRFEQLLDAQGGAFEGAIGTFGQ